MLTDTKALYINCSILTHSKLIQNSQNFKNFLFQETAIHPATRALLQGKRPRMSSRSETLSKAAAAETATSLSTTDQPVKLSETDQPVKLECESVIPSWVSPTRHEVKFEPRGMQYKSKRRIIVGNVSRWIECDQREDLSTHKVRVAFRRQATKNATVGIRISNVLDMVGF